MPVIIVPAGLIFIAAAVYALVVGGGLIIIAVGAAIFFGVTALEKFYWSARRLKADLDPLSHDEILKYVHENLPPGSSQGLKLSIDEIKRITAQYSIPTEFSEIDSALRSARHDNYVSKSWYYIAGVDIRDFGFTSPLDVNFTSANPNAVIKWIRRTTATMNHLRKNAPLCMEAIKKNRDAKSREQARIRQQEMAKEIESEQLAKQKRLARLKSKLGK